MTANLSSHARDIIHMANAPSMNRKIQQGGGGTGMVVDLIEDTVVAGWTTETEPGSMAESGGDVKLDRHRLVTGLGVA